METTEQTNTKPNIVIDKTEHTNTAKLDPLNDGISSLELIRVSGSDVDIANAARVSYGKQITKLSERDVKIINFLMAHKHTSPFEHNQLSFRVKCPMFVARQWMRHRMNSYNEISYRYAKAPEEFFIPEYWRIQDKHNKQSSTAPFKNEELTKEYKASLDLALKTYKSLLEQGVCREQARGVLPTCIYTQFIFTCNLHSLMHFITLRLHKGAQLEIQKYAHGMLELALPHFPVALGAWHNTYGKDLEVELNIPTLEQTLDL